MTENKTQDKAQAIAPPAVASPSDQSQITPPDRGVLDSGIFGFIMRYSKRQQIGLVILTLVSFPFLYASLELPKTIINQAIGGDHGPRDFYGVEMEQLTYLWLLCGVFLGFVLFNGAFKYIINVSRGAVAERMLRRLRFMLLQRTIRFPSKRFKTLSQGEIVSMVTAETEPLGGFFGEAISLPLFQGGTLLTILAFLFIQDPIMGIAAIALYPLQGYVIPKLQKRINQLRKERVKEIRSLSERIGEVVGGVNDIQANDTEWYELSDISSRLGRIFSIRYDLYRRKFFIKFLNNFLAQLTPFFFYAIGGWLVITGDLTFGSLVAVIAAYKDLYSPWKELLNYYQQQADARVKYDFLVEQFQDSPEATPETDQDEDSTALFAQALEAQGVTILEDDQKVVDNASFSADFTGHVLVLGSTNSGKEAMARALIGLETITAGSVTFSGRPMETIAPQVLGRDIGYVDDDPYIRSGSIRDNLDYGLRHRPFIAADTWQDADRATGLEEAIATGNTEASPEDPWICPGLLQNDRGDKVEDILQHRMLDALQTVGLRQDLINMGLRSHISAAEYPELTAAILKARHQVQTVLQNPAYQGLVEVYDSDFYLQNATVAENILFGIPREHPDNMRQVFLSSPLYEITFETDLINRMLQVGIETARVMVELFKDLPPGHDYFEQYSFVQPDDLPDLKRLLTLVGKKGADKLSADEQNRFFSLAFRLIPAQHRLGILDEDLQARILETRRRYHAAVAADPSNRDVAFFDPDQYIDQMSISDNILFGKTASQHSSSQNRIRALLHDVINEQGLLTDILELALRYEVGVGGKRLSPSQRQQVGLARMLIKNPRYLVLVQPLSALDRHSRSEVLGNLLRHRGDQGVLCFTNEEPEDTPFTTVWTMEHGKIRPSGEVHEAEPKQEARGLQAETAILSRVPFFSGLDLTALKLLAFVSERATFRPGEMLMRQGQEGKNAYVILNGQVDILLRDQDGIRKVASRGAGDLVGELSLLCDAPRTASIQAASDVEILRIHRDTFLPLIRDNPLVGANLAQLVAERFEVVVRSSDKMHNIYDMESRSQGPELFLDTLEAAWASPHRSGDETVMIVSLTDIETALEGLDAKQVQRVYRKVVRRIRENLQESDSVARLGRMDFAVLFHGRDSAMRKRWTEQTLERLEAPMTIGDRSLTLKGSPKIIDHALNAQTIALVRDMAEGKA